MIRSNLTQAKSTDLDELKQLFKRSFSQRYNVPVQYLEVVQEENGWFVKIELLDQKLPLHFSEKRRWWKPSLKSLSEI